MCERDQFHLKVRVKLQQLTPFYCHWNIACPDTGQEPQNKYDCFIRKGLPASLYDGQITQTFREVLCPLFSELIINMNTR